VAYLPLDISHSALINAVRELHVEFPHLPIYPLTGDFQQPVEVPEHLCSLSEGTVVYFPGSTIGNLSPDAARQLLERLHGVCRGGGLLLGVDLQKEPSLLELAYNDREGVTAAFNINLLHHLNRELGANFDAGSFKHRALYQTRFHRIEMHLVSTRDQIVEVAGTAFHFRHGESICTEHSYKFTIPELRELAAASDFELKQTWTDDRHWFAVCYLTPR
jgi:dimethylhistidine N-methyltransferase